MYSNSSYETSGNCSRFQRGTSEGPNEKRIKYTVFMSISLKSSLIFLSIESTAAKTAIIEKIPMVTPNNDKSVRNLLLRNAFIAKLKLSESNRKYKSIILIYTR